MSFFSCAWVSGITITERYPSALATIAIPIPVLPAVPSTMTPPGRKAPRATASLMIAIAARSLTDPPGFMNSALPRIVHAVASEAARSLMSGVRPIAATTSRTGFIAILCVERVKGRRRRALRQASTLATSGANVGRYRVFHRLEDILDARLADQPLVVRDAQWGVALLWQARSLRPRPRTDGDPHLCRGRDPAVGRAVDFAARGSLSSAAPRSAAPGGDYRAWRRNQRAGERGPWADRVRRGRRTAYRGGHSRQAIPTSQGRLHQRHQFVARREFDRGAAGPKTHVANGDRAGASHDRGQIAQY